MTRLGWQALLLLPLLAVILGLGRILRARSAGRLLGPRSTFLIVSILVHAGLLLALDLVLITIPVVESHRELIEAALVKTFSIFPSGLSRAVPSWERLPEGPPLVDPAVVPARARFPSGQNLPFDPDLTRIAPTIPEEVARSLPPERVLFLPRPDPPAVEATPSELPRSDPVSPEPPPPEPATLARVIAGEEARPDAPAIKIQRVSVPDPARALSRAVELPGRVDPAPDLPPPPRPPDRLPTLAPPPDLPIPPAVRAVDLADVPPELPVTPRAVAGPAASPAIEAPGSLPRKAARDPEPARRPESILRDGPRLDLPPPARDPPRADLHFKLDGLPPGLPAIRLPESGVTLAIVPDPPDPIASFAMRPPEVRKDLVKSMGGTESSEAAVDRGLSWLAAHQGPEGNWGLEDLHCQGHRCESQGIATSNAAATGLSLMAFLGAGHSPSRGSHAGAVRRGVAWLVAHQKPDGSLSEPGGSQMYGHALASIALCEALGMGADPALREPAARAIRFIVDAQDPKTGGWRYQSRSGGDTSVFGWQVMALKSAEMAGLPVPAEAYRLANRWLDSVASGPQGQLYAYQPGREVRVPMTAEALLCRQYLGADRSAGSMTAGGLFLRSNLPRWEARNSYYWYYATQVMYHLQGDDWAAWNGKLRDMLVEAQVKDGTAAGSWDPARPSPDKWGDRGGRVYETAISLLILEVYYRHLPLYQQLSGGGTGDRP